MYNFLIIYLTSSCFAGPTKLRWENEEGNFFQGDIDLEPDQSRILFSSDAENDKILTTGLLSEKYRWPKEKGKVIVPYTISTEPRYCKFP